MVKTATNQNGDTPKRRQIALTKTYRIGRSIRALQTKRYMISQLLKGLSIINDCYYGTRRFGVR